MRNDYKVICEKKYYVVFTDGQGKEQKIEISKEVAQVIQGEQTKENTIRRSEERHTVSFDAMDYEGDFVGSYDSYEMDGETPELSREEKVRAVLKAMKPRQAELLRLVYLSHYTHERIAAEKGCQDRQLHSKSGRQKRRSKKYLKNFSEKPYNCPLFCRYSEGTKTPRKKN